MDAITSLPLTYVGKELMRRLRGTCQPNIPSQGYAIIDMTLRVQHFDLKLDVKTPVHPRLSIAEHAI
jgi:hypothetical protein